MESLIDTGDAPPPPPPSEPAKAEPPKKEEEDPVSSLMGESASPEGSTAARLKARLGRGSSGPSLPAFLPKGGSGGSVGGMDTVVKIGCGALALLFLIIIILAGVSIHLASLSPWPNLCTDKECLRVSAQMLEVMNTSVDPCQNFYQYACGNWATKYPPSGFWDATSWNDILTDHANDYEIDVLEDKIHDGSWNSAERKGKTFFQSCKDTYTKTATGGRPVVQDIKQRGGWAALPGTGYRSGSLSKPTDLNNLLQAVHTKYGTQPFFKLRVFADWDNVADPSHPGETWIPGISIPTLPASTSNYLSNSTKATAIMAAYSTFVYKYTMQLAVDYGITVSNPNVIAAINQSVADVIAVETSIAQIISGTQPQYTNEYPQMQKLGSLLPGVVDFQGLLGAYFNTAGFTRSSIVDLYEQPFLAQVSTLIGTLLNGTASQQRMLNNYIMWQVAYSFHADLGWEYVHLNREWVMVKYAGAVRFLGQYAWCVKQVEDYMPYILDEIYIQKHFNDVHYQQANTLFQNLKAAFAKRIDTDKFSWMADKDRAKAKLKLQKTKDKIGYPVWLRNPDNVNQFYAKLTVQMDQHFANVMSAVQFVRGVQSQKLATHVIDQYQIWDENIWDPHVWYEPWWNELFFPAGVLQEPILNPNVPAFLNYASMGSIVSEHLQMVVNLYGSGWDENGYHKPWYSKSTTHNWFSKVEMCNYRLYQNQTFCWPLFHIITAAEEAAGVEAKAPPPTPTSPPGYQCGYVNAITFAYSNIYDVSATDNSFKAYRAYIARYGKESSLPGFRTDNTDEVFLTWFAQGWCVGEDPYATWIRNKYYGQTIPENFVNTMVTQLPEFAAAFSCPASSPGGKQNKCTGL